MKPAQSLALAASMLVALAATGSSAQSADDNPPVETVKNAEGESVRVQRFQRSAFVVELDRFTIAERKMLRQTFGTAIATAQTIPLECPAMPSGKLNPDLPCTVAGSAPADPARARLATRLIKVAGVAFPPIIPEMPVNVKNNVQRIVRFDVQTPAFPATDMAAPEGPLLTPAEIPGVSTSKSRLDYPPAALRRMAEGRMVATCQVQVDLSIACAQDSFDPPENAALFADTATGLYLGGKANAKLASGADAIGARFRVAITFKVPGK